MSRRRPRDVDDILIAGVSAGLRAVLAVLVVLVRVLFSGRVSRRKGRQVLMQRRPTVRRHRTEVRSTDARYFQPLASHGRQTGPTIGAAGILRFPRYPETWWQKPLTVFDGRPVPAELAVLYFELRPGESGAWLNSRKAASGVVDLERGADGKLKTVRTDLPDYVSTTITGLYARANVAKGAPDLVLWTPARRSVRFVEVKCPHWDAPTPEQMEFLAAAREVGIEVRIAEWEFNEVSIA